MPVAVIKLGARALVFIIRLLTGKYGRASREANRQMRRDIVTNWIKDQLEDNR